MNQTDSEGRYRLYVPAGCQPGSLLLGTHMVIKKAGYSTYDHLYKPTCGVANSNDILFLPWVTTGRMLDNKTRKPSSTPR